MKPFVRPTVDAGSLDWDFFLEFPSGGSFASREFPVDPEALLEWCEQMLPYFNTFSGLEARRLSEKCPAPFVLWDDPSP